MKIAVVVIALLCIVMLGYSSCTRVGPGYVGIKVSMAGDNRGVNDYASTTGWVFYNPVASAVLEYPTFVQTASWRKGDKDAPNEELTFGTRDKMQVQVDVSLAYHLDYSCVPKFYVQFRNDDLKTFTHGFFRNVAKDVMVEVGGKYSIDQIMGDNEEFLNKVRADLGKKMEPICVRLDQFGLLGNPRPPETVITAINSTTQATQKALQIQNEVMQAEAQARKNVAQAEGEAKSQLIRAEAEATANRKISESLTNNLVEWKRIDKWDGKMPQVTGGAAPLWNIK